ncbi:hypothetical protein MF271_07230 [Deinococcus sp. KNUC1210]|uniref:hypothetical protein n=1 Tax=Deinococcus sp. KNUC1210 TaxID=2917691 RepID=UPI001EF029AD|nr:hypothetical protein [Deinococcus sp. KNUC1210]ULH16375.1 hypothetical protein MF271_07230 [Deinococcus sp. KNUC1210]
MNFRLLTTILTGILPLTTLAVAQKLGTFDYSPSSYFKYFSQKPTLNTFQCGTGRWAVIDPDSLYARGQARPEGLALQIEMNPASWQLEQNYRGRELPITSVEVITDAANGQTPLKYVYKPSQVRYDTKAHLLLLTLPPVANQTRFVLGKINLADKACSGSMLFLVRSIGG